MLFWELERSGREGRGGAQSPGPRRLRSRRWFHLCTTPTPRIDPADAVVRLCHSWSGRITRVRVSSRRAFFWNNLAHEPRGLEKGIRCEGGQARAASGGVWRTCDGIGSTGLVPSSAGGSGGAGGACAADAKPIVRCRGPKLSRRVDFNVTESSLCSRNGRCASSPDSPVSGR